MLKPLTFFFYVRMEGGLPPRLRITPNGLKESKTLLNDNMIILYPMGEVVQCPKLLSFS